MIPPKTSLSTLSCLVTGFHLRRDLDVLLFTVTASFRFPHCHLETKKLSSLCRFSKGLWAAELMCFVFSHSFVTLVLAHCHAIKTIHDAFSVFWEERKFSSKIHLSSCLLASAKTPPQSTMFPPLCLTMGLVF